MSSLRILVAGATGKQGGALIRALLSTKQNHTIYGLTRSPTSPSALKLKSSGINLITGNMDKPSAIFAQLPRNIDAVFSVQVPGGSSQTHHTEEAQGKAFFDAAKDAGVKHFVYSSVARNGQQETEVPHFASKHRIEQHIIAKAQGSGTGWTILQPVVFMENLVPGIQSRLFFTGMEAYVGKEKGVAWVTTKDIGVVAAQIVKNPQTHRNRIIPLAGDYLTLRQLQTAYTEVTGLSCRTTFHSIIRLLFGRVVPEMATMLTWFRKEGFPASYVADTKAEFPFVSSYKQWALAEQRK